MKATTDWKKHLPSSLRGALEPRDLVLAVCGGILLWAPLAYGSVHPWAYVSLGLALAILSTILLARVGLAPFFAGDSLWYPAPPSPLGPSTGSGALGAVPACALAPGCGGVALAPGRTDQVAGERLWSGPPDPPFFEQ